MAHLRVLLIALFLTVCSQAITLTVFDEHLVVGYPPVNNTGVVLVYNDLDLISRFYITTSDDVYPISVSVDFGIVAVAGIGNVGLVFCYYNGCGELIYIETPNYGIQFGRSVAVTSYILVVGAPLGINPDLWSSGVIFVYELPSLVKYRVVYPIELRDGDHFGMTVSAYSQFVLVGAPYHRGIGAVYLFVCETGLCSSITKLVLENNVRFGVSLSISDTLIVTASDTEVAIWDYDGNLIVIYQLGIDPTVGSYKNSFAIGSLNDTFVYECSQQCAITHKLSSFDDSKISSVAIGQDIVYIAKTDVYRYSLI